MTALFLVRHEPVPVEEIRPNDVLVLPNQRRVTVESVDVYGEDGDGEVFVVRWWRPADRGEPGHRGGRNHAEAIRDEWDGRYRGSCMGVPRGHCWNLDRSAAYDAGTERDETK